MYSIQLGTDFQAFPQVRCFHSGSAGPAAVAQRRCQTNRNLGPRRVKPSTARNFSLRIKPVQRVCPRGTYFLFGPRQTGKTFLIDRELQGCRVYNLLRSEVFAQLSREPERLRQEIGPSERLVVIDEIQRLPSLLNEVHLLIEERGLRFLLTGSSARKLRRGGVNLLGGRARVAHLHPFVMKELGDRFDLERALSWGLLPSIYLSDSPEQDLAAYVGLYLAEEIAAEAVARNIPAFSRFLSVAATCNGQLINYSSIGSDAQVAPSTVRQYFSVLKDTLIGWNLPCLGKTRKRKPLSTDKFYFFDVGVARHLQGAGPLRLGAPGTGEAFETYIHHELRAFCSYRGRGSLHYWRSRSGFEVDFILDEKVAIEVKAKRIVSPRDLRGLKALAEEGLMENYLVVCFEQTERRVDEIHIVPWKQFLEDLWAGRWTR